MPGWLIRLSAEARLTSSSSANSADDRNEISLKRSKFLDAQIEQRGKQLAAGRGAAQRAFEQKYMSMLAGNRNDRGPHRMRRGARWRGSTVNSRRPNRAFRSGEGTDCIDTGQVRGRRVLPLTTSTQEQARRSNLKLPKVARAAGPTGIPTWSRCANSLPASVRGVFGQCGSSVGPCDSRLPTRCTFRFARCSLKNRQWRAPLLPGRRQIQGTDQCRHRATGGRPASRGRTDRGRSRLSGPENPV